MSSICDMRLFEQLLLRKTQCHIHSLHWILNLFTIKSVYIYLSISNGKRRILKINTLQK